MRRQRFAQLILLTYLFFWAAAALAEPQIVTLGKADRQDLSITVYQDGYAQVRDRRRLALPAGRAEVRFADVSARIEPQTAIIRGLGTGSRLLEVNFDYDLLTPRSLMEKSVGEAVWFLRALPRANRDTREAARLLSATGGAVLDVGGRIEVLIGREAGRRIAYRGLPPNLRPSPTLSVQIESPEGGQEEVSLSYLTGGMEWHGTYRIYLSADGKLADIDAYLTLLNESGISYENVELHALAGEVNRVEEVLLALVSRPLSAEVEEIVVTGSRVTEVSDYQLYTVPTRVSIADNQEKQLELFSAKRVGIENLYAFTVYPGDEEEEFMEATSVLRIENTEENGLGIALPAGELTLYARDREGRPSFLVEGRVTNTPRNQSLRLELGATSVVTGKLTKRRGAKSTCKPIGERYERCVSRASFIFRVKNPTSRAKTLEYSHNGFRNVSIVKSTFKASANGEFVSWEPIKIRAGRTVKIRYTLEDSFTRLLRDD